MANTNDELENKPTGSAEGAADADKKAAARPKKKNIVAIFHPENSRQGRSSDRNGRPQRDRNDRSGSGNGSDRSANDRTDRNNRSDRSGDYKTSGTRNANGTSQNRTNSSDRMGQRRNSSASAASQPQTARGIIKPRPLDKHTVRPSERIHAEEAAAKAEEIVAASTAAQTAPAAPAPVTSAPAETASAPAAEAKPAAEVKPAEEAKPAAPVEERPNVYRQMEQERAAKEAARKAAEEAARKAAEETARKAAEEAAQKENVPEERPNVYRQMEQEKAAREAAKAERPNVYRNNDSRSEGHSDRNNRGEGRSDRNNDRNGSRSFDRNGEGRSDRNNDRNGSRGYSNDRSGEGRSDRNNDRNGSRGYSNDRNGEGRSDRNNDRNGSRSFDRNGEGRNNDRNGSRSFDRNNDNRGEGRSDRSNDRNGSRSFDRNGESRGEGRFDRNNDRNGSRGYSNDRNGEGRSDRNNDRNGSRSFGSERSNGGSRFGGSSAVPAAEEVRGKESRERGAARNKNNNAKSNDHDKLGKKQENYINLEKHGGKKKPQQQPMQQKADPDEVKTITLPEKMTLKELADAMKLQPSVLIKNLFMKGEMCTMNSEIDYEKAEEIAMEFNFIAEQEEKVDVIAELLKEDEEDEEEMVKRPPVVCVMGHVDHGKTSLLDAIRSTRVTAREAGGITQAIGASVVSIDGQKITFLDTPGHEAFTAMRMRGANSTDIAVLVVAADDGVMPQTIEAINHAKAAGVEIIVAINKIDKPGANIERVKQEMTEYGLVAEDWGGSTVFCPVSAKTHEGIDNLLEMILLTADVMELKANPNRNARGLVIEAELDKGRGSVATVLVQKGTLHVGDCVACGSSYGKVRAMIDDKGRRVKEAIPSTPVEILGLNSVPNAGETFVVCDNEKDAKAFADTYIAEEKTRLLEETKQKLSLESLFSQIQAGNVKELNLIVKADVQGSVEAVKQSLVKLSNEEVVVKVIHGGVGAINESDVILASASNAIIIGFNVRPDAQAKSTAEHENVEIRLYNVIYTAIEEIERKMKGMKDPVYEEKILGHAEIRMIFKASGVGNIAGSYVMDGIIERGCKVRITREGKQIYEGSLASLKRFKDDVKEVKTNYECGLVFEDFNDIQELDMVEAYKMVEVKE